MRIAKIVQENFDPTYYLRRNPDLAQVADPLVHYLRHGWKEGRDPVEWFSVADYLDAYPDVASARIEPFEHYLKHGRSEGRRAVPGRGSEARAAQEFESAYQLDLSEFPSEFNARLYALAAGLPDGNRWDALAHFVENGIFQPRLFAIGAPLADLLASIGDFYDRRDSSRALRCFQLAERAGGGNSWLLHKIGDCYLNLDQKVNAQSAYLRSIELGGHYYWTFFNLATACFDLGDFESAVQHFRNAFECRPDKYQARHKHRAAAAERFHVQWLRANALSLSGDDAEASKAMSVAISAYQNELRSSIDFVAPAKYRTPHQRVAIFGSDSLPQCKLYRIRQKIDQLAFAGMDVDFYNLSEGPALAKNIVKYDCLIVYRAPALPEVIDVLHLSKKFGLITFYDIDDLIFDDSCYPPSREALSEMVSPAEYAGLVTGRVLFREAMALCDYGIASTPPLQEAMAKIVSKEQCFLSRNGLSDIHLKQMVQYAEAAERSPKFVFFYGSGSRSHNENFSLIELPLAKLLRKHPNTELRLVGPLKLGKAFAGLDQQIVRIPFTSDVTEYWKELARADVNLAPLTSGKFNDGKSEIKWMEAAMFGIPSVVSSSAVYDPLLKHGEDGFVARTESDWAQILEQLVTEPGLATVVGARARERVLRDYAIEAGSDNLLSIINRQVKRDGLAAFPREKPLVLVVNIFFPPEYIGGATRVVEQNVTDILENHGEKVSFEVFCGREPDGRPGEIERYVLNGIPVTSISPYLDQDSIERSVETESFFEAYLDTVRPDLIHFHCIQRLGASLLDVAKEKNIPYVVSVHDGWWISDRQFLIDDAGLPVYESGNWGDGRRLGRLKTSLNNGRSTLAVSHAQASLYKSRGISNVLTVANGSETLPGVEAAPTQGPVWLGLLGGLGVAKGSELLRQVLAGRAYDNLRFLVVDHSMLEGTVRYEWWGANRVEIIGKASFANVAKVYSRIHVVLAISVCVESFGLVAREAQRLGRWVIASNRGGMAEDVLAGANGYVVDPSALNDLSDVLDRMNDDPDRYLSAPATESRLRGRKDVADDIMDVYTRILSSPAPQKDQQARLS